MLEHALFQMFWQVVLDDERAFDDALSPSVSALDCRQPDLLM